MAFDPSDFIPENVRCYGKRYVANYRKTRAQLTTYDYWRTLFITAALSRFKWEGLPECVDTRYIELLLLGWGCGAFTKRTDHDTSVNPYWFGRVTQQGQSDIYNNPVKVQVIAPNGFQQTRYCQTYVKHVGNQHGSRAVIMPANAVCVYDNMQRVPVLPYIDLAARRLAEFDTATDQQINAMKVPYILAVSEEGRANAEQLYNRIASGQPAIYASPEILNTVSIQVLQTMPSNAYAGDKILNDQLKIVSQMYTFLGIDNNAQAEKKERVQTQETLANNEQFMIQRRSALEPRQKAAAALAKIGLENVTCNWAIAHTSESAKLDASSAEYERAAENDYDIQ
jgi:hypothetical protein